MTKFPVFPGILLLLILATITARGADDLFAPEPVSPASSASPSAASQVSQPSLAADTAAMAEAAAAISTVPPISVNPVNSTNSDSSTLLEQNQTPAPTPSPSPATAAPSVSTQEAAPIKDAQIKDAQAVGAKSQAAAPSLPIDQPPNLDQPPDVMAASAPPPTAPSENVTLNLINRLVQRGILTKEDAGDLIRQAKEDAQRASQQSQVAQQAATQAATAQQMAMEAAAPPSSDEAVSVSYVPEIVKSEMRDEIKRDVIAVAQSEGWATPNYPSWINNLRPFMDLRTRYQGNNFSTNNGTEIFDTMNFNAVNSQWPINLMAIPGSSPLYNYFGYYQAQNPIGPPTYNTTQQRNQTRVRFRFGADMDLGENFTSGFRIGTGQNGSPVSENQTFGFIGNNGMAQGGNFSSYAIWLDRSFLKYEIGSDPDRLAAITVGRFDNPFYTPTTIMWANDIGFDGVAAQARYKIFKGFTPFASVGIFPIYNTDLNFPATQQTKQPSNDKYLYAGQAGIDWKITKDLNFKSSAGYYYFQNIEGRVSAPGVTPNQEAQMSTDDSRPGFAQRGNTYMMLRNIEKVDAYDENGLPTGNTQANYINDPTQGVDPYYINQFQYFGLVTPYNILSANARLEYRHWEPFVVSVSGEWDRNLAWNSQNIVNNGPVPGPDNNYNQTLVTGPVNNLAQNSGGVYNYNGGNTAWIIQAKIGSGALQKRWDWDLGVSYRYVESDAVIDGFCDSDFGGGGTNLKGYAVGGNLALSKNVFLGARWMSATGIAGPTYKADILQLDLNARF
jgi:polyhydroxyalkanoate synthesis regulator phasin